MSSVPKKEVIVPVSEQSDDLWRVAYNELTEKEKILVGPIDTKTDIKDIKDSVTKSEEEARKSSLNIRISKNHTIFLHDVFAKVANWIKEFVAIGDFLVSLDPAHAALPWALVKGVCAAVIKNEEKHAVVTEGLEKIPQFLTFGLIAEKLYFSKALKVTQEFVATQELKKCLINMYQTCLQFLGNAKDFTAEHTLERIWHSVTPTKFTSTMKDFLGSIESWKSRADDHSSFIRAEMQMKMGAMLNSHQKQLMSKLDGLDKPIMRIEERTEEIDNILKGMEKDKVLDWVSDVSKVPYDLYHTQIKENKQPMPGTGQWLLKSPTFLEWQGSSTSGILWLHGTVGTGKSCLLYTLVQREKDAAARKEAMQPAYFYCARISEERSRSQVKPILQSLLRQLVSTSGSCRGVYEKLKQRADDKQDVDLDTIIVLLSECVRARKVTTIYIDALDECEADDQRKLLKVSQDLLSEGFVKVFVTSRNDDNLKNGWLKEVPEISVTGNKADIDMFIETRIDGMVADQELTPQSPISPALRDHIKMILKDRAKGMFQWVALQLRYLAEIGLSNDHERLREKVGGLTSDLKETYQKVLDNRIEMMKLDDSDKARLDSIFRLMLVPARHIAPGEFATIVAAMSETNNFNSTEILRLASNLLVKDSTFDSFRFAHQSAREYLLQRDKDPYILEECQDKVAVGCLNILLDKKSRYGDAHDYARAHWGIHSMFSRKKGVGEEEDAQLTPQLVDKLTDFLTPDNPIFEGCALSITNRRGETAFGCAATNGYTQVMNQLLKAPKSKSAIPSSQKHRVGGFALSSYIGEVDPRFVLHARCRGRGRYPLYDAELELEKFVIVDEKGDLEWKDTEAIVEKGTRLRKGAKNVAMEGPGILSADVRQPRREGEEGARWEKRRIDLNARVMNSNGKMVGFVGEVFRD